MAPFFINFSIFLRGRALVPPHSNDAASSGVGLSDMNVWCEKPLTPTVVSYKYAGKGRDISAGRNRNLVPTGPKVVFKGAGSCVAPALARRHGSLTQSRGYPRFECRPQHQRQQKHDVAGHEYSEKYFDDEFEYRHVILPKHVAKNAPKGRLLPMLSGVVWACSRAAAGCTTPSTARSRTSCSSAALRELIRPRVS